jgi:DNA-binding MarR family transcriptional regulator
MKVNDSSLRINIKKKNNPLVEPSYRAWVQLNQTRFAIIRLRDLEFTRIGLTPEQSAILQMLKAREGKSTVTQLANIWMRQRHSVSALVNRMQRQGLIKSVKVPNRKDREIVITEKGQDLAEKINADSIIAVFSFLSPEERQKLSQYLKMLLIRAITLLEDNPDLSLNSLLNEKNDSSVFNLWRLLDCARFVIGRLRDIELARIGLTQEQAAVLQILINRNGKATVTDFSNYWMRQRHSVSTLVNRMQKQGFVKNIKYLGRKELEIVITPEGTSRYGKLTAYPIDRIFSFLTPEEVQKLTQCLNILLNTTRSLLGLKNIKFGQMISV